MNNSITSAGYRDFSPMVFISRHVPTAEQEALANAQGFSLFHVGDMDAFMPEEKMQMELVVLLNAYGTLDGFCGFSCVHPLIAMHTLNYGPVGIFQAQNRAPDGEKPLPVFTRLVIREGNTTPME